MAKTTVNERLKVLVETLGMSVNAFSEAIGVPGTTTRNYLVRGTNPKSEFLAKVTRRFEQINPNWLLLGEGAMMLQKDGEQPSMNQTGSHYGNNIGINHGDASSTYTIADCARERDSYKTQLDKALREIELLTGHIKMQETIIQGKDEMLDLLRGGFNRPN